MQRENKSRGKTRQSQGLGILGRQTWVRMVALNGPVTNIKCEIKRRQHQV